MAPDTFDFCQGSNVESSREARLSLANLARLDRSNGLNVFERLEKENPMSEPLVLEVFTDFV
jgi:hypothetical protein